MPESSPLDRSDLGGEAACFAHELDEQGHPPTGNLQFHLPEPVRRRMERLKEELGDAGVVVPTIEESVLLREIDRARFPRRHERRFPSYGAIVTHGNSIEAEAALEAMGAIRLAAPRSAAREMRRLADGVQSFSFVTPTHAEIVLLPWPVVRESELVRFRRTLGPAITLVNRTDDGTVRVFGQHQIVIFDGTRWWTKPDAHEYTVSVRRAVGVAPFEITQSILDFCVHTAGPGAGGTMLVWCLDDDALTQVRRRSVSTDHSVPIELALTEPIAHSAARHALFQIDGAGIVDRDGAIIEVGVHLRPSVEAHDRIAVPAELGTRHAAAMRTSYDVPGAVFFVVSEDGPVTVYSSGHVVASIDMTADDRVEQPT